MIRTILIIFALFSSASVYAKNTADYTEIIKHLDIYSARDWIEINREMLLDTRLPDDMRDQLRHELALIKQRLEHMRGELNDSELDKQRGIIIDERIQDIQNILTHYEPGNTTTVSRPSSSSIAREDKILNSISILEELESYQRDVQHALNRMTQLFYGPNAAKTLKASFKEAGCTLDHWKAWGDWIYTASQDMYPRQREFLTHISKAIQTVKSNGSINNVILKDIRKGMRKWRYDAAKANTLLDAYVKINTERGLALQERNRFEINSSKFKASQTKLDLINAQISPITNALKDPELLNIQVSHKQNNESKDSGSSNQEEEVNKTYSTLLGLIVFDRNVIVDGGEFDRAKDNLTYEQWTEWLAGIDLQQESIEYHMAQLVMEDGSTDHPPAASRRMEDLIELYSHLPQMRERIMAARPINYDLDQNPDSIMFQITDYHVATWGVGGSPISPEDLQLLNDLPPGRKSKSTAQKFSKTAIKEVPLKSGGTARMTYVDKQSEKPSKIEMMNSSGKPEKVILFSRKAKGGAKRLQGISSKGSQRIETSKEMIRVLNRDKKGNISGVKSFFTK